MTFEPFHCTFVGDSRGFKVTPEEGTLNRRGGDPQELDVSYKGNVGSLPLDVCFWWKSMWRRCGIFGLLALSKPGRTRFLFRQSLSSVPGFSRRVRFQKYAACNVPLCVVCRTVFWGSPASSRALFLPSSMRVQGPGDNRIGTLVVETEDDKWIFKVRQQTNWSLMKSRPHGGVAFVSASFAAGPNRKQMTDAVETPLPRSLPLNACHPHRSRA